MQNTEIDAINWHELLREIETIFLSKQGGDSPANDHVTHVLRIIEYLRGDFKIQSRQPQLKAVNKRYPLSYFLNESGDFAPFMNVLNQVSGLLRWEQGYKSLPEDLYNNFAFCNLMGYKGHVFNDRMVIGILLLGANTYYPPHMHDNIQELYVNLNGQSFINGDTVKEGETSYIKASEPLSVKTGEEPVLLLYSWLGDKQMLAKNSMRFVEAEKS